MFYQYHRYTNRYQPRTICEDSRLRIAYPSDVHSSITAGQDFYVIGTFEDICVSESAQLLVELIRQADGKTVRTVSACRRDNHEGIFADFEGILSEDSKEAIRQSGMPDLVYDPENPKSFWYTWNKAYYSKRVYAALIYGGIYASDRICQQDRDGIPLEPLKAGEYEVRVTLQNKDEKLCSAKTIMLAEGHKDIVLSRYSPEAHVQVVRQFAMEQGFEEYSDPYAGIWDTKQFAVDWPAKVNIEIPERWHFLDAREYQTGRVHCFDYHFSDTCVGYQIELAGMLAKNKSCVDDGKELTIYYYRAGHPPESLQGRASELLSIFPSRKYIVITEAELEEQGRQVHIQAICKPLPLQPVLVSGCEYRMADRICTFDYQLFHDGEEVPFQVISGLRTGVLETVADGTEEFLPLHADHRLNLEKPGGVGGLRIQIEAKDGNGVVWDRESISIPAR